MGGSGASRPPRTKLDSFVIELVRAYPCAVISTHGGGRIPLTDAIYDWIEFPSKDTPLGGGMGVGGVGEDGMMGAGVVWIKTAIMLRAGLEIVPAILALAAPALDRNVSSAMWEAIN